jgi:hypothetical protein
MALNYQKFTQTLERLAKAQETIDALTEQQKRDAPVLEAILSRRPENEEIQAKKKELDQPLTAAKKELNNAKKSLYGQLKANPVTFVVTIKTNEEPDAKYNGEYKASFAAQVDAKEVGTATDLLLGVYLRKAENNEDWSRKQLFDGAPISIRVKSPSGDNEPGSIHISREENGMDVGEHRNGYRNALGKDGVKSLVDNLENLAAYGNGLQLQWKYNQ